MFWVLYRIYAIEVVMRLCVLEESRLFTAKGAGGVRVFCPSRRPTLSCLSRLQAVGTLGVHPTDLSTAPAVGTDLGSDISPEQIRQSRTRREDLPRRRCAGAVQPLTETAQCGSARWAALWRSPLPRPEQGWGWQSWASAGLLHFTLGASTDVSCRLWRCALRYRAATRAGGGY